MAAPTEKAAVTLTRADIRGYAKSFIDKGDAQWEMVQWYFGDHGTAGQHTTIERFVNHVDDLHLDKIVRQPMLQLPSFDTIRAFNTTIARDAFPVGVSTDPFETNDEHTVLCFTLRSSRPLVFLGTRESRAGWMQTVAHAIRTQFGAFAGTQLEVIAIGERKELAYITQDLVGKNKRDAAYPYDALPTELWGYFQKLPAMRAAHDAPTKSIVLLMDDGAHLDEVAMMLNLGKQQQDTHVIVFSDTLTVPQLPSYAVAMGCEGVQFDGISEPVTRSQAVLLNDKNLPRYWRIAPTLKPHQAG